MPKVNAWGENHLWSRYRKGSKLSGLVEPRIPVSFRAGSVKKVAITALPNFYLTSEADTKLPS